MDFLSGTLSILAKKGACYLNFLKLEDFTGGSVVAQIMTIKEVAKYLKLHPITISKLSKEGKIPSFRIGSVWRFDKKVIDKWIAGS